MIRSFFSSILFYLFFILFQTAILSNITILPAVPDLMLIMTLYISLHNGCMLGQTTGFTSGLMIDFLSAGPLGLNSLIRTILGYVFGLFSKTLNTTGFFLPALYGFTATIIKSILLLVISFFFPNGVVTYSLFSYVFLFELIANTILTPLLFSFLNIFSNILLTKPEVSLS
ncbi:MAG TPA: rod shape-determining protein MreD [Treponemataceae bacterium]|nr:rod shape-determining protein MreD [Treponemataceae bacterium]